MLVDGEVFLSVNSINHWVKIAGAHHDTIPMIVVHGGPGGNNYNFERTIGPHLESFATVVYYEQRGCGRSSQPVHPGDYSIALLVSDLKSLLEQLKLDEVILLGFSFGGELALEFSLAHPTTVRALVLQAPSVGTARQIAQVQLEGFESVAQNDLLNDIRSVREQPLSETKKLDMVWQLVDTDAVDRFLFHNPGVAKMNRRLWEESGLVNTGDMHRELKRQNRQSLLERVHKLNLPTLVLVGRYDKNVGVNLCAELAALMPKAEPVIFENSAHFPEMEEPELYTLAVRDSFLATCKVYRQRDSRKL